MKDRFIALSIVLIITSLVLDVNDLVEKTTAVEFVQYTTVGFVGREKYGLTHKEIVFTSKIGGPPVIADPGDVLMVTYRKESDEALDGVTFEPVKITENFLSHVAHLGYESTSNGY